MLQRDSDISSVLLPLYMLGQSVQSSQWGAYGWILLQMVNDKVRITQHISQLSTLPAKYDILKGDR